MREGLQDQLFEKYPWLKPAPEYGPQILNVGDGWYTLLDTLCHYIDHAIKFENECITSYKLAKRARTEHTWTWKPRAKLLPYPTMAQIKEKFGGLRFYHNGLPETRYNLEGAISFAEQMSYSICEECGHPGKPNEEGWIITLCEPCREKRNKERGIKT